MAAAEPLRLTVARCALNSAVICTTVATDELQLAVDLGRTARAAGFGCIAVLPFDAVAADGLDASDRGLLALLPPPTPPLLPRPQFCGKQYLSRRRQFHRMRLWRMLLEAGFHVLGVDPMLRLDRNPLPALGVLRVRADGLQVAGEAYLGAGSSPDVVGGTPGFSLKQIYTYCVWLRSTPATRLLLAQAEARTFGGQDAQVLSEELNWGAGANASCCHSNCLAKQFSVAKPPPAPARPCASQAELPLAPPPPNRTRNTWPPPGTAKAWKPAAYNALPMAAHHFGRCTGRDVACSGLHETCPPPPPPYTRQAALAESRRKRGGAKKKKVGQT